MDKAVLKKFAIESRQDLMQRMKNKIKSFYINEEFSMQQNGDVYILTNDKHNISLSKSEYKKRQKLKERVKEIGMDEIAEEASYTWFNRIIAIRYMEINDYLPLTINNQGLGIRILSSKDNTPDPEIMKFSNLVNPDLDIRFEEKEYLKLKDINEKFKYILLKICHKLGTIIPQVFGGHTDYIDILLPDNLLNDSGFVNKLITDIPEDNFSSVEIIGWLYQFYISEKKDEVFTELKSNKKIDNNDIPAATQLFTPDWIVKYMVENSLGQFWIERNNEYRKFYDWKYILDNSTLKSSSNINIESIKFLDPCCGSGHILVYAFEVFYKIYVSLGYKISDIPKLILKNNLFGLDIDERAEQLSCLSIALKAMEYDKNIFSEDIIFNLNVTSIKESNTFDSSIEIEDEVKSSIIYLIDLFKNAKDLGSILKTKPINIKLLEEYVYKSDNIYSYQVKTLVEPLIKQYKILSQTYDVVVTNPPYMGASSMNNILKSYLNKNYNYCKQDLFAVFIDKCMSLCKKDGYFSLIMPPSILFLGTFEKIREKLLSETTIISLLHMGRGIFGVDFGSTAFVIKNGKIDNFKGKYFRLHERTFQMISTNDIEKIFLYAKLHPEMRYDFKQYIMNNFESGLTTAGKQIYFSADQKEFLNIPKTPIAYWLSDNMLSLFESSINIGKVCNVVTGMTTANNEKYLRYWFEVNAQKIKFPKDHSKNFKWFPYQKGGDYRKWYGNNELVVNWENDGYDIKHNLDENGKVRSGSYNEDYILKEGITWSYISSTGFGVRLVDSGYHFDNKGSMIFTDKQNLNIYLGYLNSNLVKNILELYNPTMSFQPGDIMKIPFNIQLLNNNEINNLVTENIEISRNEWNSFENSWDFKINPLVSLANENSNKCLLADMFAKYKSFSDMAYFKLKNNEEKLNNIINTTLNISEAHAEDNITTLRRADKLRDICFLISYAVGCMFGRYSLDKDGLIYAGGDFNENQYLRFKSDSDNIIPITDETYFDDDIVQRFRKFMEVSFGKETLNENLDFIAEALGKKGTETSEETIRRYFVNDFFNDHVKMYQKRPIYWLLDSGKKNGFKALIYMHRYNENLIPKARLDYLHKVQTTYEKLLSDVNYKLTTDLSMTDKKDAQKRQSDLNAKLQEIKEYDEKIAHIANQRISIDLDDGVKINYEKFKDILAKIK